MRKLYFGVVLLVLLLVAVVSFWGHQAERTGHEGSTAVSHSSTQSSTVLNKYNSSNASRGQNTSKQPRNATTVIYASSLPLVNASTTNWRELLSSFENKTALLANVTVTFNLLYNGTFNATKRIVLRGNGTTTRVLILEGNYIKVRTLTVTKGKLLNATRVSLGDNGTGIVIDIAMVGGTAEFAVNYTGTVSDPGITWVSNYFQHGVNAVDTELVPTYFLVDGIPTNHAVESLVINLPDELSGSTGMAMDLRSRNTFNLSKNGSTRLIFTFSGSRLPLPFVAIGQYRVLHDEFSVGGREIKASFYVPKIYPSSYEDLLVNTTENIVRTYSHWYGEYPYDSLNIVLTQNFLYHGINLFHGNIFITYSEYLARADYPIDFQVLAHELAHTWYGDYSLGSSLMSESFATYSQITYMGIFFHVHPEVALMFYNTKDYLEWLNSWEKYVVKYSSLPITLAQTYGEWISDINEREAIMYFKGAFVLRSLQFTLGNETFHAGMRRVFETCHSSNCTLSTVLRIFDDVSGRNLTWFYSEWFNSTSLPNYTVRNLGLLKTGDGYTLNFTIDDGSGFKMPLQVEVVTANGSITKTVWVNGTTRVSLKLKEKPEKIILDPNEWIANFNRVETVNGVRVVVN